LQIFIKKVVGLNKILLFTFLLLVSLFSVYAEEQKVEIDMFYAVGCPYCAKMEVFLDGLAANNTNLQLTKYDINQNINLFFEFAKRYNFEVGENVKVPVVFVHEKVFVGYNDEIAQSLKDYILQCVDEVCKQGGNTTQTIGPGNKVEPESRLKKLTLPAVITAAAVDSINPCEFAVLILLLTTILLKSNKRKALFAGLAFTLAIYLSYLAMGIGLYSAIKVSGLTKIFYIIVSFLAVLVGLFNLKDYLWYGKWFIMEVPLSWRPRMKMLIKSVVSVPGAFLIGVAVSLFLLPCTSGPYIVILGLLAQATTKNYAMLLLLLYNFIFVIPMLIITFAVYFGFTTTEQAEQWRTKKLKILHLITGVIMVLLGIGMLIALWLGYL
jgi:cytochrome c biogenesis protein CcdA/glutaredoxin